MPQTTEVHVYCAGSLRPVMTAIVNRFQQEYGVLVQVTAGPSGLLRERIEHGERPDLFASANLEHPRALQAVGVAGPTVRFARNQLAVLSRAAVGVTPANLLDRLLDPSLRLGTSTPGLDPGGDYAWEMFRRAERIRPGSYRQLTEKARQIAQKDAASPGLRHVSAARVAFQNGEIDLYVTYHTSAFRLRDQVPDLVVTEPPADLAVETHLGLTLVTGACGEAGWLALYLLSPPGQALLEEWGFRAP